MVTRTRPRTPTQRRLDTLETLRRGGDAWVSSASATGEPYLVALSYFWDGARLTVATRSRSKTARNLSRGRWTRVALVLSDDVVILEGPVEGIPLDADDALAAAHAAATGFDVRREPEPYAFFRLTPTRVQAMRTPDEEPDRTIMRDGRWLDD
jgi:hypothetical protein